MYIILDLSDVVKRSIHQLWGPAVNPKDATFEVEVVAVDKVN